MGDSSGGEGSDYLAVYLQNGSVVLQLNLASGREGFTGEGRSVGPYDDGVRHSIEVRRSRNQADLAVDGTTVEVIAPGDHSKDLQYMRTYTCRCYRLICVHAIICVCVHAKQYVYTCTMCDTVCTCNMTYHLSLCLYQLSNGYVLVVKAEY